MKKIPDTFRIATLLMALGLGCFAIATIGAEALTPTQGLYGNAVLQSTDSNDRLANFAAAVAPLRGDLLADIAAARAAPIFKPGKVVLSPETIATRERALVIAEKSLSLSPHASGMWLLMAMLLKQGQAKSEALKMSYLTSPADVNLIPARVALVSAASSDDELKNLGRGDIRLILTRRPDLKPAISSAFGQGSAEGKAYLEETVRSLDPKFADSLR